MKNPSLSSSLPILNIYETWRSLRSRKDENKKTWEKPGKNPTKCKSENPKIISNKSLSTSESFTVALCQRRWASGRDCDSAISKPIFRICFPYLDIYATVAVNNRLKFSLFYQHKFSKQCRSIWTITTWVRRRHSSGSPLQARCRTTNIGFLHWRLTPPVSP